MLKMIEAEEKAKIALRVHYKAMAWTPPKKPNPDADKKSAKQTPTGKVIKTPIRGDKSVGTTDKMNLAEFEKFLVF